MVKFSLLGAVAVAGLVYAKPVPPRDRSTGQYIEGPPPYPQGNNEPQNDGIWYYPPPSTGYQGPPIAYPSPAPYPPPIRPHPIPPVEPESAESLICTQTCENSLLELQRCRENKDSSLCLCPLGSDFRYFVNECHSCAHGSKWSHYYDILCPSLEKCDIQLGRPLTRPKPGSSYPKCDQEECHEDRKYGYDDEEENCDEKS